MSEENSIANNRFVLLIIIIFIPLATFGLYVYEIFYKDESAINSPNTQREKASALFLTAKNQENKSKFLAAYNNYELITELYKSEKEINKSALARMEEIKTALGRDVSEWMDKKNWKKLKHHKKTIERILPDRVDELEDAFAKTGQNDPKKKQWLSKITRWRDEAEEKVRSGNFEGAIAFYQSNLSKIPKIFQKKFKKDLAQIHFEYAMKLYEEAKKVNDIESFVSLIKTHLRKAIKLDPKGPNNKEAKELLKSLK